MAPQEPGEAKWVLTLEGLTPYREAHSLQLELVTARKEALNRDIFISLEHPPVFTLGKRGGIENLKVSELLLKRRGIEVVHVERGGDITYHGPGQAVIYPILKLDLARLGIAEYVTALEEVMIRTAADWRIRAERNSLNRGVWVGPSKLGSIGIAVRRGVSFHGLALNANTRLDHFSMIHPCGLQGVTITSMAEVLGKPVPMDEIRRSLLAHIEEIFKTRLAPIGIEEIKHMLTGPVH